MIKFQRRKTFQEGHMGYKEGIDRKQLLLLPASVDDYVPEYNICRLISAFTDGLDMLTLGYKYAECKSSGNRPYDPRMMLNLYIYGYLHRVRSSRRLRDETRRNIEAMWLMEGLEPDDKTICNFRKDNAQTLKRTFREFCMVCRDEGLYGGETVATDSVKIRANNSLKNNHNKVTVKNALAKIDKRFNEYMAALEQGDKEESEEKQPEPEKIKIALERLKIRKEKYKKLESRLENESEVSTIDTDSRLMRTGGEGRRLDVCYNVQTVVDSKHHLIAGFEVSTCSSDAGNLKAMSEMAKETMGAETLTNLADSGYYDSDDIVACEQDGVTCLVAKPAPGGYKKEEGFQRKDFKYDHEKDVYICPCQKELAHKYDWKHNSGRKYHDYYNARACRECEEKALCTKAKFRQVQRLVCQDTLDIVDERTRKNRELYHKRQEIVEHVFGTVKAVWGYRQFLCRKKPKVTAETALAYLAYNMRRVVNIFAESRPLQAVG